MHSVPMTKVKNFRDLDIVQLGTRLVIGEAVGEPYIGQRAVAWVVRNRVESGLHRWFGAGYEGVMLKRYQFSCFNPGDYAERLKNVAKHFDELYVARCMRSWSAVYFDLGIGRTDPTHGADHYHTIKKPRYAKSWPPMWADETKITTEINAHVFYKLRN